MKEFLKEKFHFHLFELEHLPEHLIGILFGGGGGYNDLKFCRLLLLLWRGKNDYEFLIIQLQKKKMCMNFLLVERKKMMMNFLLV